MARKIITFDMLKELREFSDGKNLITSFYLATIPERGDFVERTRNQLDNARKELESADYTDSQKKSVLSDFERIEKYVNEVLTVDVKEPDPFVIKGVAIFASSDRGFFQVYYLPNALRERVVFDYSPFIRPLTLLLDEYKRYLVAVVDHKKARFYEMFMGAIVDTGKVVDVNQKARLKSPPARLKRKYDYAIAEHYLRVGEMIDTLMEVKQMDLLIIGAPKEFEGELMMYLPFRIRQKIAGTIDAEPTERIETILEKARKVEESYEREEEKKIVEELRRRVEEGQFAVSGLKDTLDALMHNQVQTLVVEEGYEVSGVRCPKCGFLGTDEEVCPVCG
jgi:peptide chain release factor subunit 1